MELCIHFPSLPEGMDLMLLRTELADVLEEDGWLTGSGPDWLELELEDERVNPKYGILAVKNYLQQRKFVPETTIELAGTPVGIYE